MFLKILLFRESPIVTGFCMMTEEKEAALFNQCADLEKVVEADENHFTADTKSGNIDSDVAEPKNNFSAKKIDSNDVENAQIKNHPDSEFVKNTDLSLEKQENTSTSSDLSTDTSKVPLTELVSSEVLISVTETLHYPAAPPPPLPPRPQSSEIVVTLNKKFDDAIEVNTNHCGADNKSQNKESDATASPKNDFMAKEIDENYNDCQPFQSKIQPNSEIVKNVVENLSMDKKENSISSIDLSKDAAETPPTQHLASEASVSGASNRPAPPLPPRPSQISLNDTIACKEIDNATEDDENHFVTVDKLANGEAATPPKNELLANPMDSNCNDVRTTEIKVCPDSGIVKDLSLEKLKNASPSINLSEAVSGTLLSVSKTSHRPAPPPPLPPLNDTIVSFCKKFEEAIKTAQTEGPLIIWPPPNISEFMHPGNKDLANALFEYAVPAKLDFELFQGMLDRFSDASGDDLFKCEIFAIGFIWRSLLAAMFLADGSFGTSMLHAAYLRHAIPSLSRFEVSVLKNFLETSVELNAILPLQLEAVTVICEIHQPSK